MSFQIRKVNNVKVEVPEVKVSSKKFPGDDLFDIQYFCMELLGKRLSGKTSLIYTLLKKFVTKEMIVLFFVPTFHKDKAYKPIRKFLKQKKITYDAYTSVEEDGVNMVEAFMDVNKYPGESEEKEEVKNDVCKFIAVDEKGKPKKKKKDKPREYFIIFDDMTGYLRKPAILKLIKLSRHFRTKIIISTQSIADIHPDVHAQMDYIAVFKNFNEDSLDFLYEKLRLGISLEQFKELYHYVTSLKFERTTISSF